MEWIAQVWYNHALDNYIILYNGYFEYGSPGKWSLDSFPAVEKKKQREWEYVCDL